ncbi:dehydration-responsive element-binding protein 2A [Pyrus ussuriensis x Pyrus communis]|uniref:Dehydration-responsive element-binding protein 2A n=1 Tax=Pyrus ussuriensis x Pyrus communis TaxID=2448454 RepID=A0A5N5HSS5_9ROSA|nr:dehydration-responsive element-binding protein 2A [Pyrus ussuriensis x Pyrus communis]
MVVSPSSTTSVLSALEDRLGLGAWCVRLVAARLGLCVDASVPLFGIYRWPWHECLIPFVMSCTLNPFSV